MAERQAELPEEHGWAAGDLEEFMEPHIVALRDLAANDRPPSRLLDLASTRRWLTSYIAKFRKEHPAATAKEWRGLLAPVWSEALNQTAPLEEATLDEVRDARTDNAAATKLLCTGTYELFPNGTPTHDDLGRMLDRV
jgi:hypothetical protein